MAQQQPPSIRIRAQDFPDGIADADAVEKLGQLLNPVLRAQSVLAANGVNAVANLDASSITFNVTTPSTDWTDFTPSGWTNAAGAYPNFGWRRDRAGNVYLRGRLGTLPALGTTLATLPVQSWPASTIRIAVDAAGAFGAIEITAAGVISQKVGSIAGTLDATGSFAAVASAPAALSCWPQQIRAKDGRRPIAVLLQSVRDVSQSDATPSIATTGVQWSYVGTNPSKPNLISVDDLPGLALGRTYAVTCLVLYS